MLPDISETIVAQATPSGEGGICVIRLSGENAMQIAAKVVNGGINEHVDNPRFMILSKIIDQGGDLIDEGLVVFFKKPSSYSGDDTFEFHCHGGEYVSHRIIETLVSIGARRAYAGEFTMRAFLNGRIDLTQAEGILALISSGASPGHKKAINLLRGGLKERMLNIKNRLINMIAPFEAVIDHPDDDITSSGYEMDTESIVKIREDILSLASGYKETPELDSGLRLAIVGRPNVGKSSLMNLLMMKKRVLVHDSPGTTRDVVSEEIILGEGRFRVFDTAGLRDDAADIEAEGIELAKAVIDEADACIVLLDMSREITEDDIRIIKSISHKPQIICGNKSDLERKWDMESHKENFPNSRVVMISCKTEEGFGELVAEIKRLYRELTGEIESGVVLLKRHYEHLVRAGEALSDAESAIEMMLAADVISIDLRRAFEEILKVTGEHYDDVLLEEIFSQFCIGK